MYWAGSYTRAVNRINIVRGIVKVFGDILILIYTF